MYLGYSGHGKERTKDFIINGTQIHAPNAQSTKQVTNNWNVVSSSNLTKRHCPSIIRCSAFTKQVIVLWTSIVPLNLITLLSSHFLFSNISFLFSRFYVSPCPVALFLALYLVHFSLILLSLSLPPYPHPSSQLSNFLNHSTTSAFPFSCRILLSVTSPFSIFSQSSNQCFKVASPLSHSMHFLVSFLSQYLFHSSVFPHLVRAIIF